MQKSVWERGGARECEREEEREGEREGSLLVGEIKNKTLHFS